MDVARAPRGCHIEPVERVDEFFLGADLVGVAEPEAREHERPLLALEALHRADALEYGVPLHSGGERRVEQGVNGRLLGPVRGDDPDAAEKLRRRVPTAGLRVREAGVEEGEDETGREARLRIVPLAAETVVVEDRDQRVGRVEDPGVGGRSVPLRSG